MSTLADSFLLDLQDLEDDEEEEGGGEAGRPFLDADGRYAGTSTAAGAASVVGGSSSSSTGRGSGGFAGSVRRGGGGREGEGGGGRGGAGFAGEEAELDIPIPDAVEDYEKKQQGDYVGVVVSDLLQQPTFVALLEKVRALTPQEAERDLEELQLIEECNQTVIDIDRDILSIHKFIRDIYSMKFPELESIVQAPLEYIAVVLRLQNHTDMSQVDLSDLLPSPTIMALTVAASLSVSSASSSSAAGAAGRRLPDEEFCKAIAAAKEALALAERRKEILQYLESRMSLIAPNVSSVLGAALAARLLTRVGGLKTLAKMPAQNLMVVGSQKKTSFALGGSTGAKSGSSGSGGGGAAAATGPFSSLLCTSEILLLTPPAFRTRALRLLCGKVSLAARLDLFHAAPDGSKGQSLREEIVRALIRAQEPPPAPQRKALPAPDERARPKRGGKKHRRMKEKYELTEVHKQLNRMQFGVEEDQHDLKAKGLGMLGKSIASGRLKLQVKQQKLQPSKKRQQQLTRVIGSARKAGPGSATGAGTSGFCSSLTFTPIQGLELYNPDAVASAAGASKKQQQQEASGTRSYFSSTGKFVKIVGAHCFRLLRRKEALLRQQAPLFRWRRIIRMQRAPLYVDCEIACVQVERDVASSVIKTA